MDFYDMKNQYDNLVHNLKNEQDELNKTKELFSKKQKEVFNISELLSFTEKELNNLKEQYDKSFEKKVSKLDMKIKILLGALFFLIEAILLYNHIGLAILAMPLTFMSEGCIYLVWTLLNLAKPKWLLKLLKKDEKLSSLDASIEKKQKQFDKINLEHTSKVSELSFLNSQITSSNKVIKQIENEINKIMISYATPIFEQKDNETVNIENKPLTRIKKLDNDKN